jgi:hypothetical protein
MNNQLPAITPATPPRRPRNWIEAKQMLEKRISGGVAAPDVTELHIEDIELIEGIFQHRSGNQASSGQHRDALVRSLRSRKGVPLDPLVVFWVGDKWVMVDGHHRHQAYEENGRSDPVPVTVFPGTLDEAIGEALRGNSRDKLVMGKREKSEAAWRLVIGTDLRSHQIVESSTMSKVTIYKMNKVRDAMREEWPNTVLADLSWIVARDYEGLIPEQVIDDEWQEKQAKEIANRLVRTFGGSLGKQPEILWRAIEIYDTRMADQIKESLGVPPEDDDQESDF